MCTRNVEMSINRQGRVASCVILYFLLGNFVSASFHSIHSSVATTEASDSRGRWPEWTTPSLPSPAYTAEKSNEDTPTWSTASTAVAVATSGSVPGVSSASVDRGSCSWRDCSSYTRHSKQESRVALSTKTDEPTIHHGEYTSNSLRVSINTSPLPTITGVSPPNSPSPTPHLQWGKSSKLSITTPHLQWAKSSKLSVTTAHLQ